MPLRVAALWRYPIKSLAGESITEANVTTSGLEGDRIVQVHGPEGIRSARVEYRLLGLRGALGDDGHPRIDGQPWDSADSLVAVRRAAGDDSLLVPFRGLERFDRLPLLVATDGAVAAFGRDIRRLRPNILIGGVEGLSERAWEGGTLQIGRVLIDLDALRARCPVTTVDPDTLARDPSVLRDIGRRFQGRLALDARVRAPGVIRVGDAVRLVRSSWR